MCIRDRFYSIEPDQGNKKFHLPNYILFITDRINNRLKNHGLNMVSVNKRNLFSLLVNNKEKSNTLEKNGFYEIPVSYTHLDVYKRQV